MQKHAKAALTIALTVVGTSAALAQESTTSYDTMAPSSSAGTQPKDHSSMQGMDHGSMQGMDHGSMQGMDHGSMQGMDHGSMQGMDHGSMQGMDHGSMQGMDHGSMQMQGGSPPPDARDPNAYSGGYQLGVGKYALGNTRQLMMADEHNFGSFLIDRLEWVVRKHLQQGCAEGGRRCEKRSTREGAHRVAVGARDHDVLGHPAWDPKRRRLGASSAELGGFWRARSGAILVQHPGHGIRW
jgi:uncharacterized protein involved in copper resistance